LQRIYDSDLYKRIFPLTKINSSGTIALSGQYLRNREILEYVGMEGYFRNTTVQGSITGESLDLGVIDDPLKGRKEANSETVRNATWDWFTDDFFTRFSEDAGMLFILTRWHIDDPVGRLIKTNPSNITVLKYPAIAIENEKYRKEGEPLFPEHKSLKFLLERRKVQGIANFEALYQQNPIVMGGKIFQKETFRYFRTPRKYKRIVQSWDTAYKPGQHNDPSVCTVWGVHDLGYDLLYVWCKKVSYPTLKKAAIDLAQEWANKDEMYARHKLFSIIIEDKASGQALIPDLRDETNFSVVAIKPEGDKLTRAHVVTPQFEAGKVFLLENANWLENYEAELLSFDNGIHDDQVDSTTQFLTYISVQSSGILQDDYVDGDFDEQTTDKW
jgi:predicted phage terminase large subunit-like protein